jgi:hypothetical protein
MLEVVVIPFDGAVQAGVRSIVGHSGGRAPDAAQRVALAKRCAAEPGPHKAPAFGTVPALRSGMKNAASRPGHNLYVSTSPVLDPLAAESLRPCGKPKYDSELISISRDEVRLNSLAS